MFHIFRKNIRRCSVLTPCTQQLADILVCAGYDLLAQWPGQTSRKSSGIQQISSRRDETMDFTLSADKEIDSKLIRLLTNPGRFNVQYFLTEEGKGNPERNAHGKGKRRAVIDAIDGTSNFATGRPDFGICVRIEADGVEICSGIFAPARGELLVTEQRGGTYFFPTYGLPKDAVLKIIWNTPQRFDRITTMNFSLPNQNKRASVLETSRIYIHTGKRRNYEFLPERTWNTIYAKCGNPLSYASCAVALLETALGKLDGAAIGFQNYWDFAAGMQLIENAGGCVEIWDIAWCKKLGAEDFAEAHASVNGKGEDLWLAHVLAARNEEVLCELKSHFTAS
jgi:fructose-1,6-bisphosphatase/inositol monophosphatase family enzyme